MRYINDISKPKKKSSLVKRGGILLFELRFQDKKLSISCKALTWLWTMVLWPKHWRCTHKRIAGTGRGGWMWILSLWTLKDKGAFTPLPYDCKGFENEARGLMACLPRYKCLPCKPDPEFSPQKSDVMAFIPQSTKPTQKGRCVVVLSAWWEAGTGDLDEVYRPVGLV